MRRRVLLFQRRVLNFQLQPKLLHSSQSICFLPMMPDLFEQCLQWADSAHLRSCVNTLPEGSGLVRCAFVPSPPIEEQWARSVWTRPHYLWGRNAISGFLILLGSQVRRKLSQHAKVKFRPHSSSELILPSLVCLDRLDIWEWENTEKVICLKIQLVSHEMMCVF